MVKRDVIFLANFYPSSLIFEQLAVISMLPRYHASNVLVILPFFPTGEGEGKVKKCEPYPTLHRQRPGTMERVDDEGQVPTAVTLATLLSAMPMCRNGASQLMIYDIHVCFGGCLKEGILHKGFKTLLCVCRHCKNASILALV